MSPDIEWNIGKIFQKWSEATPHKPALIVDNDVATFRELNIQANQAAHAFNQLSLRKGDRVAMLAHNSIATAASYIAAAKLGLIYVPINNRLMGDEILFQINNSGSKAIVFDEQHATKLAPVIEASKITADRALVKLEDSTVTHNWCTSFYAVLEFQPETEPQSSAPVHLNDPQTIIYTSGTTGAPKGAVISHLETHFKCMQAILTLDLRQDDRSLSMLPFFHSAGLFTHLTATLFRGSTLITSHSFDPQRFLALCSKHQPTVLHTTTTIWRFILKHMQRDASYFDNVRTCMGGGERTPLSLIEELKSYGINMRMAFGQTENSFMACQDEEHTISKFGTVGRAGFFSDIWIQGGDGNSAPTGEAGEIVARGPTVMTGYWNLPEKTAETIVDGILHTGDIGKIDEDGYISLVDRAKDMYRTGAENVYPKEVESIVLNHTKIHDAAIIGVPDPEWGETGKIFVVPEEGESITLEEIHEFLDGKIARYKFPKKMTIMDALPVNHTGKVIKAELKKLEGSR
jgi:fatty-acyl-CoA synthase